MISEADCLHWPLSVRGADSLGLGSLYKLMQSRFLPDAPLLSGLIGQLASNNRELT